MDLFQNWTGENEHVECKLDLPQNRDKYLKTAVAFANGTGGRLIFGIKNGSWDVVGFPMDEVSEKRDAIANSLFDACEPSIVAKIETHQVDGRNIIVATIPSGMSKPYFIKAQGLFEGTYIRVDGVTRKAGRDAIQELILDGSNQSFDQLPQNTAVPIERISAVCERLTARAREKSDTKDVHILTPNQLASWGILHSLGGGTYAPTNGFLLLEESQQDPMNHATVQCAVFKGTTRNIFLTRQDVTGPIDAQTEAATRFVLANIHLGSRIKGMQRQDFYELPVESVREMIVNAVLHRSYLQHRKIQVALFDDRLEVTSPGRLPSNLSLLDARSGYSSPRNRGLANVFQYIHLIEAWGTGIPRILEQSRQFGLQEPRFEQCGDAFRVTLYRRPFDTDFYGVVDPSTRGTRESDDTTSSLGTETPSFGAETPSFGAETPSSGAKTPSSGAKTPSSGAETPSSGAAPSSGAETAPPNDGEPVVTLSATNGKENSVPDRDFAPDQRAIWDVLANNGAQTATELEDRLQWSRKKVRYNLDKLQKQNAIERESSNRKSPWRITAGH